MEVASSDWFNFGSRMSAEVWVKPTSRGTTGAPSSPSSPRISPPPALWNRLFSLGTETRWSVSPHAVADLATTDGWYVLNLWGDARRSGAPKCLDAPGHDLRRRRGGRTISSSIRMGSSLTPRGPPAMSPPGPATFLRATFGLAITAVGRWTNCACGARP